LKRSGGSIQPGRPSGMFVFVNLDSILEKDGPIAAGDALMHGGGAWDSVWSRFCESPRLYPGVAQLLRGPARDLVC